MLLALLSGQRCQALHCLSLASIKISDAKCVFSIDVLLKHSRKGKHLAPLEFVAFPQNSHLCVVSVLKEYLCQTKELRGSENMLLISYQKPYKHISKDTLARWIRDELQRAGVDTQHFGAHSTRMASTTAAVSRGVPVDTLMRAAGWSSESTFLLASIRRRQLLTWVKLCWIPTLRKTEVSQFVYFLSFFCAHVH